MRRFVLAFVVPALLVGCGDGRSSEVTDSTEVPAGEPFPANTQARVSSGSRLSGANVDFTPDTGQCEVMYRIYRHLADIVPTPPSGTITQANAEAAASVNGSLFLTVENWTGGDPVALQAVQDCVPYLVGKPF